MGRGGAINWSDPSIYGQTSFTKPTAETIPVSDVVFTTVRNHLDGYSPYQVDTVSIRQYQVTLPIQNRIGSLQKQNHKHYKVIALEQEYESKGRRTAVDRAYNLAILWDKKATCSAKSVCSTREEISAESIQLEELTVTLAAREEAVEQRAAELPVMRTQCLGASNEWQKLVMLTNAASKEKAALVYEELYMDHAISFYKGENGYPSFLSPVQCQAAQELDPECAPPPSADVTEWINYRALPQRPRRKPRRKPKPAKLVGSPANLELDDQFLEFKTKYEQAAAAFNQSEALLSQLVLQLVEVLTQKANLEESIVAANIGRVLGKGWGSISQSSTLVNCHYSCT